MTNFIHRAARSALKSNPMPKNAKPAFPTPKKPKRDLAAPAYRRFDRMVMRPDDSLFVAGVVVSGALFAWLITSW